MNDYKPDNFEKHHPEEAAQMTALAHRPGLRYTDRERKAGQIVAALTAANPHNRLPAAAYWQHVKARVER